MAPGVFHPLKVPKCSSISLLRVSGKLTCGQITFTEGWNPQREGKLRHKAKLGLANSDSSKAVASAQCPQQTSRLSSIVTAQSPALQSQGVPQTHRRVPQCSQQADPHSTGTRGTVPEPPICYWSLLQWHAGGNRRRRMEGRGDRDGGQGGQWWRVSAPEMEDDEDDEQMGQEGRVTGQGWRMMRPGLGGEWDKVES